MKTQKWIGCCGSLAFLVTAIFGCGEEEPPPPPRYPQETVRVYVYADTLLTYPSAPHGEMLGFAWVTDRQGRVMRGEIVDLAATPPELGYIELADSALRDTTNAFGRVEFYFHSTGVPGEVHITGSVGTVSGACTLAVVESQRVIWTITISISKTLLHVGPGHPDSTLITVCIKDSSGAGISGVSLPPLVVPGGRVHALAPTDSLGCSRAEWWPDCCGTQCVGVSLGGVRDSACVTVDSL